MDQYDVAGLLKTYAERCANCRNTNPNERYYAEYVAAIKFFKKMKEWQE